MPDANHPLWPIIRLSVFMLTLIIVLWANASQFDATELRTILTMFFVATGAETFTGAFRKRNDGPI